MSLPSICQSALELSVQERAMLIDRLWESIDFEIKQSPRSEIEMRWAAESEARIDAVEQGELTTIDGQRALAEFRRTIQK